MKINGQSDTHQTLDILLSGLSVPKLECLFCSDGSSGNSVTNVPGLEFAVEGRHTFHSVQKEHLHSRNHQERSFYFTLNMTTYSILCNYQLLLRSHFHFTNVN